MEDNISEAQYMYMNEDHYDLHQGEVIFATSYTGIGVSRMSMKGHEMVGMSCPTCESKLVVRTRGRDKVRFIACDKSKRPRCPFTIGYNESLIQRTHRIENKVNSLMGDEAW